MTTNYKIENTGIRKASGYGQYIVYGEVEGVYLEVRTTDSEAYDYFDDENYPEKQQDAIDHVNMKLELAYENQI